MNDNIKLPAAVVEAAARADYENWRDMYAVRGDTLEWEDIEPEHRDEHRSGVTAAILAGLKAWPGAFTWISNGPLEGSGYILPLSLEGK